MKRQFLFFGLALFFAFLTCFSSTTRAGEVEKEQSSKLSEAQTMLVNQLFSSRLFEIASEYKQYQRVDQAVRWSPLLCYVPPRPPANQASLSASDSEETHGKKLYYLYARKPSEYKSNIWGLSESEGGKAVRAPLGQVLVKEAWHPVKLDSSKREESEPYAVLGKEKYHAGDKKGLFIMFKMLESTPGTDQGWVYGTVSADGKKVTSVGLVENCMQCHRDAPRDRQIGLSQLQPNAMQGR